MTDIQRIEREILAVFVDICQRLGLRYYLLCGSALGAVKYGGFIPWDDDVDVGLPRGDYEIFLRDAPALLPENCFLQNFRSDPALPQIYSKLRRSDTTCIEENARLLPIHHGIFIDIFPLDGYPKNRAGQLALELGKFWYRRLLNTAYPEPRGLRHILEHRIKRLLGCHRRSRKYAENLNALLMAPATEEAELWCSHGNWQGRLDYAPRDWFAEGRPAVFEGLAVTVPKQAEAYLRRKYGDYHTDPADKAPPHRYLLVDCARPYPAYTIYNKEGREENPC